MSNDPFLPKAIANVEQVLGMDYWDAVAAVRDFQKTIGSSTEEIAKSSPSDIRTAYDASMAPVSTASLGQLATAGALLALTDGEALPVMLGRTALAGNAIARVNAENTASAQIMRDVNDLIFNGKPLRDRSLTVRRGSQNVRTQIKYRRG
jgi:hypothetical protein